MYINKDGNNDKDVKQQHDQTIDNNDNLWFYKTINDDGNNDKDVKQQHDQAIDNKDLWFNKTINEDGNDDTGTCNNQQYAQVIDNNNLWLYTTINKSWWQWWQMITRVLEGIPLSLDKE